DQFAQLVAMPFGFASQQANLDAEYAASLALIPHGHAKARGVAVGHAAAAAILALRANDGWNTQPVLDVNYPQGTEPGQYRFTDGTGFALLPQWGSVPTFVLKNGEQFRPPAPYPINSKRYT